MKFLKLKREEATATRAMEKLSDLEFMSFFTVRLYVYEKNPLNQYLEARVKLEEAKKTLNKAIVQIKESRNHQLVQKLQQIVDDMESGKLKYFSRQNGFIEPS
ncbi:MAG: hypothetical protein ABIA75_02350 [Candidatus Neomarinimicrobiota bacterium]